MILRVVISRNQNKRQTESIRGLTEVKQKVRKVAILVLATPRPCSESRTLNGLCDVGNLKWRGPQADRDDLMGGGCATVLLFNPV